MSRHGPVKQLTREELAVMQPNRPTSLAADLENATQRSYAAMSWQEQSEAIRRLSGKVLAHIAALIDSGNIDDSTVSQLSKVSSMAKGWVSVEEQEPARPLTRTELETLAKK
jgi:hypothetical protein